jgi:hypothetical protein
MESKQTETIYQKCSLRKKGKHMIVRYLSESRSPTGKAMAHAVNTRFIDLKK